MRSTRRRFLGAAGLAAAFATSGTALAAPPQGGSTRRGIAMTIGLNHVSPAVYPGAPELRGCINDSKAINDIANDQGFECRPTLVDSQATADAVIRGITEAAQQLRPGDIFLIQYSGHGTQVPDRNGDESDGMDEAWCLYDRALIDDELASLWTKFAAGVRILMISDSCHSGTMARGRGFVEALRAGGSALRGGGDKQEILDKLGGDQPVFRYMPDEVMARSYQAHKADYDRISDALGDVRSFDDAAIKASVVLLSGCQDNQLSGDLSDNGLFTAKLLKVWNDGKFKGHYRDFLGQIVVLMPATQTPNFYSIGQPDLRFWLQKPLTR